MYDGNSIVDKEAKLQCFQTWDSFVLLLKCIDYVDN